MVKDSISPEELANRWKMTEETLGTWRWHGKGPNYIKIGRTIFYPIKDVVAFEEKMIRQSTMDIRDQYNHIRHESPQIFNLDKAKIQNQRRK